jgi:chaperonin cofactor prefoldin
VALLFLLVVLFRGWRGDLPTSISEKGAEWQPIEKQTASLQQQLDELQTQIDQLVREARGSGG